MSDTWYVAMNKQRHGPYSTDQVKQLLANGRLRPDDMILQDGTRQWVQAATLSVSKGHGLDVRGYVNRVLQKRWVRLAGLATLTLVLGFVLALLTVRSGNQPAEEAPAHSQDKRFNEAADKKSELERQLAIATELSETAIAERKATEKQLAALKEEKEAADRKAGSLIAALKTKQESADKEISSLRAEIEMLSKETKVLEERLAKLAGGKDSPPVKPVVEPKPSNDPKEPKTTNDQILAMLLGPTSAVYKEKGYKNCLLGTTLEEIQKTTDLAPVLGPDNTSAHVNDNQSEVFYFDSGKKLVMYLRRYDGGSKEYGDELRKLFGTTDAKMGSLLNCTHVFAKVGFVTNRTDEQTQILVLSKEWALDTLRKNIAHKRANLKWIQQVANAVKDGGIVPEKWPALEGTVMKDIVYDPLFPATGKNIFDAKYLKDLGKDALVCCSIFNQPINERQELTKLAFTFNTYSPNATPPLLNQPKVGDLIFYSPAGNNSLVDLGFKTELVLRLNSLLVQLYFPPKGEEIEFIRPKKGHPYYEWRTEQGWTINAINDGVMITFTKKRGL